MPKLIDLLPKEFKKGLTKAEKLILEKAPTGEIADMRSGDEKADDPANADKWPESRSVRARFLEWLLRDKKTREFIHDKGVAISGVIINGGLDLSSATLPFPLTIRYSHFADDINLRFARMKLISFSYSYFNNCYADGLVIELSAFFNNSRSDGEFRLVGANIGSNLDCTGAKFINKSGKVFIGDSITTKGYILLQGIESTGEFRLVGANIGGNITCNGAKFINEKGKSFVGDRITTKNDIFLEGIESMGEFRLVGANIGGDLYCDGAAFENKGETALEMTQAQIGGRLCLDGIKEIDGTIDLENTKAGAFVDHKNSWPDEGNLLLDGFEYGSFADYTPTEIETRLEWLRLQPQGEYVPQPYQQLAKVYRKMGRDGDAKKVLLEKERMRRKHGDIGKLAKVWGWFLDRTIGYGYQVDKALKILVLVILAGTLFFKLGDHFELLRETKTATALIKESGDAGDKFYPEFNSFFYSLDTFVPFLDLHQESYWLPDSTSAWGSALRFYFWFHIMAGWVFSTLLIATFTGLIRRE